jgi:hypothetical protein
MTIDFEIKKALPIPSKRLTSSGYFLLEFGRIDV